MVEIYEFDEFSLDRTGWARFSHDKRFRFRLGRKLTPRALEYDWSTIAAGWSPLLRDVWVLLNPSTANAFKPDNTVTRCCEFSRRWGSDICEVVNIRSFCGTDPNDMHRYIDALDADERARLDVRDNGVILHACAGARRVIPAWGTHGARHDRGARVRNMLESHGIRLEVLGISQDGYPIHPMARGKNFIPYDRPLRDWVAP